MCGDNMGCPKVLQVTIGTKYARIAPLWSNQSSDAVGKLSLPASSQSRSRGGVCCRPACVVSWTCGILATGGQCFRSERRAEQQVRATPPACVNSRPCAARFGNPGSAATVQKKEGPPRGDPSRFRGFRSGLSPSRGRKASIRPEAAPSCRRLQDPSKPTISCETLDHLLLAG